MKITKKLCTIVLIIGSLSNGSIKAQDISQNKELLEKKATEILNMIAELKESSDDLKNLGNKEIDNVNVTIDNSLSDLYEARKQLNAVPKRLLSVVDPFDGIGIRGAKKTTLLIESILIQTKKILLEVQKSLADTTTKLNPATDPLKIYSKLSKAYTNINSTVQDLKLLEAALQ